MEFALSDDQKMFQSSVQAYLADNAPLDLIRTAADGSHDTAAALKAGLLDLGLAHILVPESHGGLGLGLLDSVLVQEALGGVVAPYDFTALALAITGLRLAGTEQQKTEWFFGLISGDVEFGVALTEHVGARENAGVMASSDGLNGKSLFVLNAAAATHFMVCDRAGGLHIVERDAPGLDVNTLDTIDRTRNFGELVFDNTPSIPLGPEGKSGDAADRMVSVGRLLLAADTLGASQTMLDKAVAYAGERKQFNRVIGSFQSVKHLCADMAAQIEPARSLVWHAAYLLDEQSDEASLLICLAKSHLAETGTHIARTATEVHGGMGFTDLLGLHYWFKRIGANRQLLGSPEAVRSEAARLQGWV
ncbi:MAG: acyl-CoA dehydrogenase family protein [Henriciella sp.]